MRRTLVVALVIVVVLTGLPILMGMGGMAFCAECGPGLIGPMLCLAALAAIGFALPRLLATRAGTDPGRAMRSLLLASLLERPPQPANA